MDQRTGPDRGFGTKPRRRQIRAARRCARKLCEGQGLVRRGSAFRAVSTFEFQRPHDVRFGSKSKADMCVAKSDVRFAPNSDRESGLPQTVMSALPLKADMCSAPAHVRFGPIADNRNVRKAPINFF